MRADRPIEQGYFKRKWWFGLAYISPKQRSECTRNDNISAGYGNIITSMILEVYLVCNYVRIMSAHLCKTM